MVRTGDGQIGVAGLSPNGLLGPKSCSRRGSSQRNGKHFIGHDKYDKYDKYDRPNNGGSTSL